jgi:hypothetical protein
VAVAAIGVAALYLVGVNVFLATPLFERVVDATPEALDVHYDRAWSLWPGHVHARKLSIRATDSNIEWILELDDVSFRLSLVGLTKKLFEASHLRGRGVTLRLRQKLEALPASSAQVADLPPIHGLPPYGLRAHVEDTNNVWDDFYWNLWTVRLTDVVAEQTREVWIDRARFVGDARFAGGCYFRPMRALDVGPLHVAVERGEVRRGHSRIVEGLGGSVDVSLSTLDPRTTHGLGMLAHLALAADLRARRIAPPRLAASARDVRIEGTSGPSRGRFVVTGAVETKVGDTTLAGDAGITIRVHGLGDDTDAVGLSGTEIALRDVATRHSSTDTAGWHGRLGTDVAVLRLRERTLEASLALDARDARPIVAALLGDRVPRIFTQATDVPHLEATARISLAPGRVALRDVLAHGGDISAAGVFAARGPDRLGAFVLEKAGIAAGLEIADDGVHVRLGNLGDWMQGELRRVQELVAQR